MKIDFILPRHSKRKREFRIGPARFGLPSLTLASLAACVPGHVDVNLTDEHVDEIDIDGNDADLIGINTRSQTAARAYALADRFREIGKTVILGGVHASLLPDEALEHADAVVVGEAEGLLERLIGDFENNRLQRRYEHDAPPPIRRLPLPRRELLSGRARGYAPVDLVMVSRGCPHSCSFCYMSAYGGGRYRLRDIDSVVSEVETLTHRLVFFVDDNLAGYAKYTRRLFERLIPCRKLWVGQTTIDVARDRQLLATLARSGCRCLFIGFESLSEENLHEVGKRFVMPAEYRDGIQAIHDHGILVYGGFILGLDGDRLDVFERTTEFAIENGIDIAQFHCPNPYPRTRLYADLLRHNRLLEERWWLNAAFPKVRYRPKHMSCEELHEGILRCYREFYGTRSIVSRFAFRHVTDLTRFTLFVLAGAKFRGDSVPWIMN